jgi:hypothetical protein
MAADWPAHRSKTSLPHPLTNTGRNDCAAEIRNCRSRRPFIFDLP